MAEFFWHWPLDEVPALKNLAAEMRRKLYDNARDIPVSPDLDAWVTELERIITALTDT